MYRHNIDPAPSDVGWDAVRQAVASQYSLAGGAWLWFVGEVIDASDFVW
jgi:hypothetical protein